MDGIDAALIRIRLRPLKLRLHTFQTYPYGNALQSRVLAAAEGQATTTAELAALHDDLGEVFAQAVLKLCRKAKVSLGQLAWIGSHGQTVFHSKQHTLQLAEPAIIAQKTGVKTVADFRPADMAAGGLGAPLTPYFNYHYFRQPRQAVLFQNIGGIGNVTYIPAGQHPDQVIAFDTGPGNMVMDGVMRALSGGSQHYDKGGDLAAQGNVHEELLKNWLTDGFIKQRPPKACGREQYGAAFVSDILKQAKAHKLTEADLLATVTALTAESIAGNCRRFIFKQNKLPAEMIVGGGGCKNKTLMKILAVALPELNVVSADERGLNSDAAEAIAFAFLAGETLAGRPNNLSSVTGAKRSCVLGKIVY